MVDEFTLTERERVGGAMSVPLKHLLASLSS